MKPSTLVYSVVQVVHRTFEEGRALMQARSGYSICWRSKSHNNLLRVSIQLILPLNHTQN